MSRFHALVLLVGIPVALAAQQPRAMTEKFFPDPDVAIPTPSFQDKRGYASPEEVVAYISRVIDGKPGATFPVIGKSKRGKEIRALVLRRDNDRPKTRVLFTARVHGDEPAGTEAMMYLAHQLFHDPAAGDLLDDLDLAILPYVNVDGGQEMMRASREDLDLNRDMTKLRAPETVALQAFATAFDPDVVVDFHEYRPFRVDYSRLASFGACASADAMILYSDNPNYPRPLKRLLEESYLPAIRDTLAANGITSCKYFTSRKEAGEIILNLGGLSPRSTSTSFALRNTISILLEIRGVGIGKTSFARRVLASTLVATSVLQHAARHADDLRRAIDEANATRDDIVVTVTRPTRPRAIPFIDVEKNELVDITLPARDAAECQPALVRTRPVAYALLPSCSALVEKLKLLGIQAQTLERERACKVETYHVTGYRRDDARFEGIREQHVTTETRTGEITLPAGTFIVPMQQRAANLAAMLLEPEADNSFVAYDVLTVAQGEQLPVLRIIENI
ncbi:MAG: hypothetical protein LBK12_00915 [Odoribacteraceae bacterium]|jgi:hypothetical protein|nr:hypothetical protein [Odoribacteraceae bacterium]